MSLPPAVQRLSVLLSRYRLPHNSEAELHACLAQLFAREGIAFTHEAKLSVRDRVDFYLPDGGVAVECKVKVNRSDLLRQMQRYATYGWVEAVVLISRSGTDLPETLAGKPVFSLSLWSAELA